MLCQASSPPTQPHKAVLVAAVDEAGSAGPTCAIVDNGLHDDARAGREVLDVGADFLDDAAEFVAEGEGQLFVRYGVRRCGDYVGAAEVFVEI